MRRFVSWLLLLAWLPWQWSTALAVGAVCAHPGDRAAAASVAEHDEGAVPRSGGMPTAGEHPGLHPHPARRMQRPVDAHAAHDSHQATAAVQAGGSHRHAIAAPPAASMTGDGAAAEARAFAPADTATAAGTLAAADVAPDCTHAHCGACCHGVVAAVLPASAAQAPFVPAADACVGATRALDLSGGFDGPFRPPRLAPA